MDRFDAHKLAGIEYVWLCPFVLFGHGPFPSGHCSGKRRPNEPLPILVWIKL